jgi:hypothetical protein
MDAKKEKYKRIRGAILKLLAHQHPWPIDSKVLYFLLDDLRLTITNEEFKSHCAYLEQKEYVKQDARKTSGVEIEMLVITPKGLDVLDGYTSDVGVDARF